LSHFLRRVFALSIASLAFSVFALAEGTRTWEQSKFDELIKGTPQGVAIRSAGGLELAPSFSSLCTTPSTFIWAIAADHEGSLYAAAGSPARVYRITPDGKSAVIFEPQALQVQALALDKNGAIYAATNPDGKVYKLERNTGPSSDKPSDKKSAEGKSKVAADSSWTSSVFFDPATKYIWDLALDDSGNLYVATGDHGEIFRVTPKGEHSVFFQSDEAHIRVLAFERNGNGNLIAGSDGSGLVYRISPKGEAFVLYSAPKKEITALALDKQGNIYAAGVGEKHGGAPSLPSAIISIPVQVPSSGAPGSAPNPNPSPGPSTPPTIIFSTSTPGATAGSEIYRIAPDGSPARIWTSHEDMVYALGFDQQGTLLAGTGNRGHVFAINRDDNYTDLLKASAGQVTAFANAPNGLYAATSNLGKVFVLGAGATPEGSYVSDVFDAHIFSRWGRAELRGTGNVELFARSGNVDNPDRNWSPWQKVELQKDGQVSVPAARFIQWKTVLHAGNPAPRVDSVTLNYLPKNVAPTFDDVTVQTGVRYQSLSLSLPKMPGSDSSSGAGMPHFDAPPPTMHDRDSIGVKWSVHDDNDDQMVYSVYYRGDGEARWLLLKDDLSDKFYSFDASLLPDGGYTIKVVVSDAPSHSPGEALTSEKESARFEVDTTPPRIENLSASYESGRDPGQIHVSFRAVDGFSSIKRAEYSMDAGEWQYVEPVGQISDSKTENYDFHVSIPSDRTAPVPALVEKNTGSGALEHVVVIRVYDRYENMSSAKTVIRSK
jgi:sugar lactone lactonase YvrE